MTQHGLTRPPHGISGTEQGAWNVPDNDLFPDLRDIARRLRLVERHLGLAPDQLAAQFGLDPPASWVDGEPDCAICGQPFGKCVDEGGPPDAPRRD